jgi:RNA polymerase sigma factor (sigma-70 family)
VSTASIEESFARILREHGSALARLAASYAHDPADREDLLQEILLAIWTALPRFRGDCSERTFAFRIGARGAHARIRAVVGCSS